MLHLPKLQNTFISSSLSTLVDKIYTIGYEGKSKDEFLKILNRIGINHLVDVRSVPRSKRQEFNRDEIRDWLFHKSIMYVHMPELGGLWEQPYQEVMETDEWRESYSELVELAEDGRTAMMCLEKDPMRCHRRYIAERLKEGGWEVIHLGRGKNWKDKDLDDFA